MVKRMSDQTQFLFISHNKIAMEMANQLIGVTMQEQAYRASWRWTWNPPHHLLQRLKPHDY
jgi:hypothetical protein